MSASLVDDKTPGDRTVMHVLYGMHTIAWASMGSLAVIALVVNYVKRGDEGDPLYLAHHRWMIRTFWWTLLWLVLTGPLWLVLVFPGAAAYTVIGLWYLYRCLRGWLRFSENRMPD
ncbi:MULTISPECIES: hypothetical protein [Ramlibacter]|uniref:Transmembrane protein n=1 Tax=Ramlibacter aquaticus TaxID=2780094 RepID=A0ABR9SCB3_9BURK|nr:MULTISPECIES: hypothetical protein [Ramlibacter]MBE7939987.1 hypothetical protein [Ramlibacter aquaticus]